MMHSVYLSFSEEQFRTHFADVKMGGECRRNPGHIEYYRKSIERYNRYVKENSMRGGKPLSETRFPCQIEKDEKFWIANCMMTLYHSPKRVQEFASLLAKACGQELPLSGSRSWEDCFSGSLHLFFEPNLSSPQLYKKWLANNFRDRQIIPHILDSAEGKKKLEGATNVDALLLNEDNGFAVIIEAKVLSDISVSTTYDVMRNQIARNIDVMLGENGHLCYPLNLRNSERTLFLLVTPRVFKENPRSRLYGFKINEYKKNPDSLRRDLPHRRNVFDWALISKRIGWLTWEDFNEVNSKCCPWLK